MSDGITVTLNNEALVARMRGAESALRQRLRQVVNRLAIEVQGAVVNRLAIEVQGAVKETKLTGQKLHVRTGTLRRSINRKVTETQGAVIATVGTNVVYAAIHEFGFNGTENVKQHVRRSRAQMQVKKTKRGRSEIGEITVRAHVRKMVMPQRSFLRSTLNDKAQAITDAIKAAAVEALK